MMTECLEGCDVKNGGSDSNVAAVCVLSGMPSNLERLLWISVDVLFCLLHAPASPGRRCIAGSLQPSKDASVLMVRSNRGGKMS